MGELSANFDTLIDKIKENNWEVHGIEVYCRKQMQLPIIEYGDVTARRYPIYSATKTITSLAVGMAADDGKMDIGRSVLAYIPEKTLSALPEEA